MKKFVLLLSLALPALVLAQSGYDAMAPFGFATVSSRSDASQTYNVTGGGCYTYPVTGVNSDAVITLTSNGQDMRKTIENAVKDYSVIIFDGSNGDFIISRSVSFSSIKNKTLLGVNGARLCTQWYMTPLLRQMLDTVVTNQGVGVRTASTVSGSNNHGKLPNGASVSEEGEFLTRRTLYNYFGNEDYQGAGIFKFDKCSNIIIRNIAFVGPGSVDVSGNDLMSFTGSTHMWVDHCEFSDGMDGNFDITKNSDFNTVSWCRFYYTERAYDHMNTNLIGGSDSEGSVNGVGVYHNTTFYANQWDKGCNQRMPMARAGKIHLLNNLYSCAGSYASVNPRKNSEFLIDGNFFDAGVNNVFSQSSATAYVWMPSNVVVDPAGQTQIPANRGSVNMPYTVPMSMPVDSVPMTVGSWAGATLWGNGKRQVTQKLCLGLQEYPSIPAEWQNATLALDTTKQAYFDINGFSMTTNANYIEVSIAAYPRLYISEVSFEVRIPNRTDEKNFFQLTLGNQSDTLTVASTGAEMKDITINNTTTQYVKIKRAAGTRTVIRNLCLYILEADEDIPTPTPQPESNCRLNRPFVGTKCLKDGRISIVRGDNTYSLLGQQY